MAPGFCLAVSLWMESPFQIAILDWTLGVLQQIFFPWWAKAENDYSSAICQCFFFPSWAIKYITREKRACENSTRGPLVASLPSWPAWEHSHTPGHGEQSSQAGNSVSKTEMQNRILRHKKVASSLLSFPCPSQFLPKDYYPFHLMSTSCPSQLSYHKYLSYKEKQSEFWRIGMLILYSGILSYCYMGIFKGWEAISFDRKIFQENETISCITLSYRNTVGMKNNCSWFPSQSLSQ